MSPGCPPRSGGSFKCPPPSGDRYVDAPGFAPEAVSTADQVIPLGNEVSQWAPLVTKGHTAVHTPGSLSFEDARVPGTIDLAPITNTHLNGSALWQLTFGVDMPGLSEPNLLNATYAPRRGELNWRSRWRPRTRGCTTHHG